jgi:hypothetical protein
LLIFDLLIEKPWRFLLGRPPRGNLGGFKPPLISRIYGAAGSRPFKTKSEVVNQ